jgi:uncharacterized protein YbaR (Trm112 family)
MKRIRCPKCEHSIVFDESQQEPGQKLVFQCTHCGKTFAIRVNVPQPVVPTTEENEVVPTGNECGSITVIENVFHYKQDFPLQMGTNKIGRRQKGNPVNIAIATDDPSVDLLHCTITVSRDKKGNLKYTLRDGPSYTGTFVDNDILGDNEQRIITDGQLFTIGATSIILHTTTIDKT